MYLTSSSIMFRLSFYWVNFILLFFFYSIFVFKTKYFSKFRSLYSFLWLLRWNFLFWAIFLNCLFDLKLCIITSFYSYYLFRTTLWLLYPFIRIFLELLTEFILIANVSIALNLLWWIVIFHFFFRILNHATRNKISQFFQF